MRPATKSDIQSFKRRIRYALNKYNRSQRNYAIQQHTDGGYTIVFALQSCEKSLRIELTEYRFNNSELSVQNNIITNIHQLLKTGTRQLRTNL